MLTQKAIDRLLAVKKHILEEPLRFNMEFIRHPQSPAPCGTTCCIAGWLIKLEYPERKPARSIWQDLDTPEIFWESREDFEGCGDIREASGLIGIDVEGDYGCSLFHEHRWPTEFMTVYRGAKSAAEAAEVGARAIDSFIAANGEW